MARNAIARPACSSATTEAVRAGPFCRNARVGLPDRPREPSRSASIRHDSFIMALRFVTVA